MAKRPFRSAKSLAGEEVTCARIEPFLLRHGFTGVNSLLKRHGTAVTQMVDAVLKGQLMRIHVRTCWRRNGRNARESLYSAAQLRARLDEGGWDQTLANIAIRYEREAVTHLLLVQDGADGFEMAALVPSDAVPAIWAGQRARSAELLSKGLCGRMKQNHAINGSSPTLWLQDDRHAATPAVAKILWDWPGVIDVMALPVLDDAHDDTFDDLPLSGSAPGRDGAERKLQQRSGFPRDPKVRAAVLERAQGRCEREHCGEYRRYTGFLDVHHILGIERSDRSWTCVALCPNCHREAHFSPDRDAMNASLGLFAERFKEEPR